MKPLLWAAAAGAATATVLLIARKAQAAPLPSFPGSTTPPPPEKTYGETIPVPLAVPAGWRRVSSSGVMPELSAQANALRNTSGFTSMAYGTLTPFTASDGQTYATWIEQHYHPPGGAVRPWGLHHGVTLLERA